MKCQSAKSDNVGHAHNKTRRRFLPNLQETSLMSESLGTTVRLRISMHGLRTIEHKGGLDAFLLDAKTSELPTGLRRLKKRIEKAKAA